MNGQFDSRAPAELEAPALHDSVRPLFIPVHSENDLAVVAASVGAFASERTRDPVHLARIRIAALELATNVVKYAKRGRVEIRVLVQGSREAIELIVSDRGPGIADVALALQDHYSSGGTLGLGLPGVKRMMDEFELHSSAELGTTVRVRKWLR